MPIIDAYDAIAKGARRPRGDRVALDKEFVLLRGLIEIAQRRMQYTSITDENGAAIKIRKAGRREMALLLGRSWTSERLIERSQVRNTPCRRKTNSNSL